MAPKRNISGNATISASQTYADFVEPPTTPSMPPAPKRAKQGGNTPDMSKGNAGTAHEQIVPEKGAEVAAERDGTGRIDATTASVQLPSGGAHSGETSKRREISESPSEGHERDEDEEVDVGNETPLASQINNSQSHIVIRLQYASCSYGEFFGWKDLSLCGVRQIDKYKIPQIEQKITNKKAKFFAIFEESKPAVIMFKEDFESVFEEEEDADSRQRKKQDSTFEGVTGLLMEGNHRMVVARQMITEGKLTDEMMNRPVSFRVYICPSTMEAGLNKALSAGKHADGRTPCSDASLLVASILAKKCATKTDHETVTFWEKVSMCDDIRGLVDPDRKKKKDWMYKYAIKRGFIEEKKLWPEAMRVSYFKDGLREMMKALSESERTYKLGMHNSTLGMFERLYDKGRNGQEYIAKYMNAVFSTDKTVNAMFMRDKADVMLKEAAKAVQSETPGAKRNRLSRAAAAAALAESTATHDNDPTPVAEKEQTLEDVEDAEDQAPTKTRHTPKTAVVRVPSATPPVAKSVHAKQRKASEEKSKKKAAVDAEITINCQSFIYDYDDEDDEGGENLERLRKMMCRNFPEKSAVINDAVTCVLVIPDTEWLHNATYEVRHLAGSLVSTRGFVYVESTVPACKPTHLVILGDEASLTVIDGKTAPLLLYNEDAREELARESKIAKNSITTKSDPIQYALSRVDVAYPLFEIVVLRIDS